MVSEEEIEILEEKLTPQQKSARTKRLKYGDDAHAKWGAKGGKARVPKGYSMNPDKTGGRIKQRAKYESQSES